jgi:hypothetical protein
MIERNTMAKIDEFRDQLGTLLDRLDSASASYMQAKNLHHQLEEADVSANFQGIGLTLSFDNGHTIPIPLPEDRGELQNMVADGASFLGNEVVRIWNEMQVVVNEAVAHCARAAQAAAAPPAQPHSTARSQPRAAAAATG